MQPGGAHFGSGLPGLMNSPITWTTTATTTPATSYSAVNFVQPTQFQ